jgi:signal transduction histidine kinase
VARGSGRNAAALAVSISLFLLGVALFVVEPSIILIVFCVFEALVVLVVAATTGILSQYFESVSPETMDTLTHHLFNLRVMLFVLIGWAVMSSYHPSLKYKRMVLLLMLLCLAAAVLINNGLIHWAIALYLTVTGLNLVLQIYALVMTGGISKKIRILLGVGYAMFTLVFWNALVNLFPDILPVKPLSSVNSFGDWRINGGPAGLIFFLFVIIYNAERKLADSKALGLFKLQAAQSEANAEKLSERQTLIDMLTHELKNPLGTMRFALASLKMQTFRDEDTLLRVKRMDMSVQRMNDLIEQVAGSNKIDRFELTDELELIDAAELIQMLISDELTDERFKLRIAPGVQFHSHRRMLAMIIENLIGNAFKYAEPLKDILINVFVQDQTTVFQIANCVNPAQLPDPSQLFKRYYRHDSVQALPGLGIGLSLVKTASDKIGAKVGFVIERNTITFTLKVPL